MDVRYYLERLSEVYRAQRWIVATDTLPVSLGMREDLLRLGALDVLAIAASPGAGEIPEDIEPEPVVLAVEASDLMAGIRKSLDALAGLSGEAERRVETFDPEGKARSIGTLFDDGRPVANRPKFGARRPEWLALEDKTTIDAFWDELGVARAPAEVVPADFESLWAASQKVDWGAGTVWCGDNREGFHGGASFVRHVENEARGHEVADFLAAHCHEVRVMPYLEGIPCSIHGIVFDEKTIAFRPNEMLVFRSPEDSRFRYAKAGTYWDPRPEDRDAMREVAIRAGDGLREKVDYRGAFTVDGVMTARGFLPTELNPRFGAALHVMTHGLDLPLFLLNVAVAEGVDVDWAPEELERLVVDYADAHRNGATSLVVEKRVQEDHRAVLVEENGEFRAVEQGSVPDEDVVAKAWLGPAAAGGYVSVHFVREKTPVGPSLAPRAVRALACVDAHWDLSIGELVAPAEAVAGGEEASG